MTRSLEKLTRRDLRRLAAVANSDMADFFARNPATARLYAQRKVASALAQGGALHYLDGANGIKDLDVWVFFTSSPTRPFPYRRRGQQDFGSPKFGQTPGHEHFVGRRVDVMGRSLADVVPNQPVETLRRYLAGAKTETARQLARKAMILLDPIELLGTVVWPAPVLEHIVP